MFNRPARDDDPQQAYASALIEQHPDARTEPEPDAAAAADADEWAGHAVHLLRDIDDNTNPTMAMAKAMRAQAAATLAAAAEARATRMVLRDLYTLFNEALFAEDGDGLTRVLDNLTVVLAEGNES